MSRNLVQLGSEECTVVVEVEIVGVVSERLFELSTKFEKSEENGLQVSDAVSFRRG